MPCFLRCEILLLTSKIFKKSTLRKMENFRVKEFWPKLTLLWDCHYSHFAINTNWPCTVYPSLTSILKALCSLNIWRPVCILSKTSLYFNQVDNQWIGYIARHKERKKVYSLIKSTILVIAAEIGNDVRRKTHRTSR